MNLKPYAEYKPSTFDWLGRLPAHWRVLRLKHACEFITDGSHFSPESINNGKPYVTVRNLDGNKIDLVNAAKVSLQDFEKLENNGCRPRKNDLLLSKDGTIGKVAIVRDDDFVILSSLAILRPQSFMDSRYLRYFLLSKMGVEQMESYLAGAALRRLTLQIIVELICVTPSLPEQQAIANFLDQETAVIDTLIAKKRQLIERLQEKRTALINSTIAGNVVWEPQNLLVTDKNAWLFPLPKNWQRQRLKFNTFMKGRLGWQNLRADEYTDEGPYLVSSEHFTNDQIDWDRCNHVTLERFNLAPEIQLRPYDVLFMKDGAAMGKLAYVHQLPGDACVNSHLLVLRPKTGVLIPRYLFYVLKSQIFQAYMIEERTGTTFFGFSQSSMGDFPISFPSVESQLELVSYLDEETSKIDQLIAKIESAIDKLQEYRTALISAAVTGKIDVRSYVQGGS